MQEQKTEQNLKDALPANPRLAISIPSMLPRQKAGYEQIAAIFLETADQEKEHAKMWFKEFHGIGEVDANLEDAAAGENYE